MQSVSPLVSGSSRVRPRPAYSDDEEEPASVGGPSSSTSGGRQRAGSESDSRARVGLQRHVRRRTDGGTDLSIGGAATSSGGASSGQQIGSDPAPEAVMQDVDAPGQSETARTIEQGYAEAAEYLTNTLATAVQRLSPPVPEVHPMPSSLSDAEARPSDAPVASSSRSVSRGRPPTSTGFAIREARPNTVSASQSYTRHTQNQPAIPHVGDSPLFDSRSPALDGQHTDGVFGEDGWRGVHPASLAGTPPAVDEEDGPFPASHDVGGLFRARNGERPIAQVAREETTFRINGHDVPLPASLRSLDPIIFTTTLQREVGEWRHLEAARRDVISGHHSNETDPRTGPYPHPFANGGTSQGSSQGDRAWRRFRDLDRQWDQTRHSRYLTSADCFRVDMAWNTPPGSDLDLDHLPAFDMAIINAANEAVANAAAEAAADELDQMLITQNLPSTTSLSRLGTRRHRTHLQGGGGGSRMIETASESSSGESDGEPEKEGPVAGSSTAGAASISRTVSTSSVTSDARVKAELLPSNAAAADPSRQPPQTTLEIRSGFLRTGMVFTGKQATVPGSVFSTRRLFSDWHLLGDLDPWNGALGLGPTPGPSAGSDPAEEASRARATLRSYRGAIERGVLARQMELNHPRTTANVGDASSARTRPRPSTAPGGLGPWEHVLPNTSSSINGGGGSGNVSNGRNDNVDLRSSARRALDAAINRASTQGQTRASLRPGPQNGSSGGNGASAPTSSTTRATVTRPEIAWEPARDLNIWERIRITLDDETGQSTSANGNTHRWDDDPWSRIGPSHGNSGPSDADRWSSLFSRHAQPIGPGPSASTVRVPRRRLPPPANRPLASDANTLWSETPGNEWEVQVTLTHIDFDEGVLRGVMRAFGMREGRKRRRQQRRERGLPEDGDGISEDEEGTVEPVLTGFDGEIIDLQKRTLWSESGQRATDMENWRQTPPFKHLDSHEMIKKVHDPAATTKLAQDYVLMRWKETTFINCEPHESGLSISGHYVVAMHRSTGAIEAYYHDPASLPSQRLSLSPPGSHGVGFASMDFA